MIPAIEEYALPFHDMELTVYTPWCIHSLKRVTKLLLKDLISSLSVTLKLLKINHFGGKVHHKVTLRRLILSKNT